jgi:hypothetical protein
MLVKSRFLYFGKDKVLPPPIGIRFMIVELLRVYKKPSTIRGKVLFYNALLVVLKLHMWL